MNTIFLNIDYLLLCPKQEIIKNGVDCLNQFYQKYPFQIILVSNVKVDSIQFEKIQTLLYQVGLGNIPIIDYSVFYLKENMADKILGEHDLYLDFDETISQTLEKIEPKREVEKQKKKKYCF